MLGYLSSGPQVHDFFLIGGTLLFNVVLVSAVQSCTQAVVIHISSPLEPSYLPRNPTPLGHRTVPGWASCVIQQLLISYRFYTLVYKCYAAFSVCPTLSFPHCVYSSVLYICISIPSLQIGSSIPFF